MLNLRLDKPLAVFDIEATGISPRADRIIELAIVKLMPDNSRAHHVFRMNPGMPIPPEASAIHGITDADVAGWPLFGSKAAEILEALAGCDLAGYNVLRYDIPMLVEEFARVNIKFDLEERRVVDAQRIFHRREPRDLTAALLFYCGDAHLDAHGAEADALATIRVLEGEFRRYPDLPHTVADLADYCDPRDPSWVDRTGKLRWVNGQVVINFGKKKGEPLRVSVEKDPGFINWILRSDFPRDTREIVEAALNGRWPVPPAREDNA
jgi:DNA polymerase III subunit epsilon